MKVIQQYLSVTAILNIYSILTPTRASIDIYSFLPNWLLEKDEPGEGLLKEFTLGHGSVVIVDPKFVDGEAILSATCKAIPESRASRPHLKCTIDLTALPFEGIESKSKYCGMKLNREGKKSKYYYDKPDEEFYGITHINDEKFILRWSAGYGNVDGNRMYYNEVYIVEIVHGGDCKTQKLLKFSGLSDKIYMPGNLMVYNESIDIITAQIDQCMGGPRCKMTYDLNGTQLGKPYPYPARLNVLSATPGVDFEGNHGSFNVAFDSGDKMYKLAYVKANGDKMEIGRLPKATFDYMPVSSAHGKFGICMELYISGDIQCYQINDRKEMVLNKTISLRMSDTLLGVYNLQQAGMLLFSSKCESTGVRAQLRCESFVVDKIYQDENELAPTYKLTDHNFVYDVQSQQNTVDIYEDANQYSFNLLESHNETCEYVHCSKKITYKFEVNGGYLNKTEGQN